MSKLWVSAGPHPLEALGDPLTPVAPAAVPWLAGACLQPTGFTWRTVCLPCSHCPPTACVLITVFVKYS